MARRARPRLIAALTRRFGAGELERIENAVQTAFVRALEGWPGSGVPERAEGWLLRVAHNVAIDELRREARQLEVRDLERGDGAASLDDLLGLIFLCAHPTLPRAGQIALTLKVACGFTTPQIARAFFSDERTLSQRIVRAKQRLRLENARFEVPAGDELPQRLSAILDVLYVAFAEGHSPTDGDLAIKLELCGEMVRLAELVAPLSPAAHALCALLCFQHARSPARTASDGSLLLLPEQDRSRWDADLVARGFEHLDMARGGDRLSTYHLEAGIAACHAVAPAYQETDWPRIVALYDVLYARSPSPVVGVNRAIAVAMIAGARAGLDELDAIPERDLVERYPYALAAYADLHASLGELELARTYLDRALARQPSPMQRALLARKQAALARDPGATT